MLLRLLAVIVSILITRLPDYVVTATCMQLIIGIALMFVGCTYEPYYTAYPGGLDQNALQTGLDGGLVTIYALSFAAVITATYLGEAILDTIYFTYSPLLALPLVASVFYLRRKRADQEMRHQNDTYSPLLGSASANFDRC